MYIYLYRCWLQAEAFFVAVLGPIAVILIMNIVVFIMVLKQLHRVRGRRGSTCSDSVKLAARKMVFKRVKGALSLFVLLGLTWLMAGKAFDEHSSPWWIGGSHVGKYTRNYINICIV